MEVSPQVASSLFDQYLEERLLQKAVDAAEPKPTGDTAAQRRQEILARLARLESITDADLKAEYERQPERWRHPPLVRLSQMILPTREVAEGARRKVLSGADWETVSRELSRAPNAASGGGLGWLERTDLPGEFEKAVWGLPAGAMTPALPAGHGVHLSPGGGKGRRPGRPVRRGAPRPSSRARREEELGSGRLTPGELETPLARGGDRGTPPLPLRRGCGPLFARLRAVTLLRRLIGTALFAPLACVALPAAGEVIDRILLHVNARIVTQSQLDERTEVALREAPPRPRARPAGRGPKGGPAGADERGSARGSRA